MFANAKNICKKKKLSVNELYQTLASYRAGGNELLVFTSYVFLCLVFQRFPY